MLPKKNKSQFKGKTFDSFLTKEECGVIINYAKNATEWENAGHEFWNNRCINIQSVKDKNVFDILYSTKIRIKKTIKETYGVSEVYPDIFQIVRWFDGMEQPVHADACNMDGSSNNLTWRDFASILYLNDDYEGGETYYDIFDFQIKPETGKLAIHLGDIDHCHGVRKISGNTRYTLTSFWGFDETKELRV